MIFPLIIFDFFIEIYHHISFPIYQIVKIKRKKYIKIDRHKLKYLTFWQKFFCIYCGYANGLIHYSSVIAAKTEEYWCGIQHDKSDGFVSRSHHKKFLKYGDEKSFNKM